MANKKITELTAIDAVSATDLFAVVDDPSGVPITKKATLTQVLASAERTANKDVANGYAGLDANGDVALSKIFPASAASRLLGRGSAGGAGDWQEITLGSGLTMVGSSLSAEGSGAATGAEGSEPGSPITGALFLPNNAPWIKRYSGAVWDPWGPLYPLKKPVNANYSWGNQGAASVVDTNGGILLTGPAGAGDNLRVRYKTAPSVPYTVTVYLEPLTGDQSSANGATFGVGFRQSIDGKLHLLMLRQNSAGSLFSIKFTNETTFSATYTSATFSTLNVNQFPIKWLRIQDDNTSRKLFWSTDGFTWVEFHSIGRTDFLTADQILFFVNANDTGGAGTAPTSVRLLSWLEN